MADGAGALQREQRPLRELALAQVDTRVALGDLERLLRGGEEELAAAGADPERPADAAREVEQLRLALVEPGRRHRAAEVLERAGVAAGRLGGGEDHLGVDGHPGLGPLEAVARHQLVVVQDGAVVDADDRAVTDGWLFAAICGWPFV